MLLVLKGKVPERELSDITNSVSCDREANAAGSVPHNCLFLKSMLLKLSQISREHWYNGFISHVSKEQLSSKLSVARLAHGRKTANKLRRAYPVILEVVIIAVIPKELR
jgi:hypothetical protein